MKNEPPDISLKIVFLLAVLAIWLYMGTIILLYAQEGLRNDSNASDSDSSMFLDANIPHYYFNPIIECLIRYESSENPKAFNKRDVDGLPKFGLLQFGRRTFKEFCVDRYGLHNDIWSVSSQKTCAHRMIQDGYGRRWGTWKRCN